MVYIRLKDNFRSQSLPASQNQRLWQMIEYLRNELEVEILEKFYRGSWMILKLKLKSDSVSYCIVWALVTVFGIYISGY